MSISSKALTTAATVFAGNEFRRLVAGLEADDILRPLGLARRRSHLGESLLFMSAGVMLGGVAAMVLSSTSGHDIREWFAAGLKEPSKAGESPISEEAASANVARGDNGHSVDARPAV